MIRLTVGMIVRNEEKHLRDCLESVKDIADEIILVDTGSTDKTLEIASDYKAKMYHYDWIDDFSAARNYALSKASGEWILYLDADERINPNSISSIKKITAKKEKSGYRCKVISRNTKKNSSQIMWYTRLFAYSPDIKFSGSVHEQIDASLLYNNYNLKTSEIVIEHSGYDLDNDGLKKKAERNLKYLIKEYNSNNSPYVLYQIGNTYHILANYETASEYLLKALADLSLPEEYKAVCYLHLSAYMLSMHDLVKALEYAKLGVKTNTGLPQLYFILSQIKFRLNCTNDALNYCLEAIKSNEKIEQGNLNFQGIITTLDTKDPIYQGIYISAVNNDNHWIKTFLDILEKLSPDEAALIRKIAANKILDGTDLESILKLINENNISCFTGLLEKYTHKEIVLTLINPLLEKIPDNSKLLTFSGKIYLENTDYELAADCFTKALQLKEKDPTAAFLLISTLIQMNDYDGIADILLLIENEFGSIPEVKERITILKNKLIPLLSTLNNKT